MEQNIVIAGATFNGVPSIEIPTSGGGSASFVEVSDTTATAADVAQGKYFYTANGVKTAGTGEGGGGATLPTFKIIDHAIAQHYNAVGNKYQSSYLQTALPTMAFKSYNNNTSVYPRLANSQFDGVLTPSLYKPSGALTGVIFLQTVDKAYNKLYIKAKSAIKVSGQSSSILLAIGSSNMAFNADGWLTDAEKSVALASSDYTAEQIMAQENLSIVSSDQSLLSEQTIVYSIPNAASDYFIGLTVWNQEIYICDMYLTVE